MRDKISAFYYPEMTCDFATLQKAILLFDEIHFMDRPSLTFGEFGTIGAASPLRRFEKSFREDAGVPLYVHYAPGGIVAGTFLEQIRADVNDPTFLLKFQQGLKSSAAFRDLQIPRGNYGPEVGTHEDLAAKLVRRSVQSLRRI